MRFLQRRFFLSWVVTTLTGWLVGVFLFYVAADIALHLESTILRDFNIRFPFSIQATLGFASLGIAIGGCQWLVLRSSLKDSWMWVFVTSLAFPVAFVGLDAAFGPRNGPFILEGTVIAAFQCLYLRTQLRKSPLWVLSCVVAWGFIDLVFYLFDNISIPVSAYSAAGVVLLLLIGVLLALPTGLTMFWLLRNRGEVSLGAS
jgi:hypothetical protein